VSTPWERKERARAERLKLIDEQVESGSLVIRSMTKAERDANPPRPPREKRWERKR
jgi:signal recognition particle GTPase